MFFSSLPAQREAKREPAVEQPGEHLPEDDKADAAHSLAQG